MVAGQSLGEQRKTRVTCYELEFLRVIWAATLAALAEEEDNSEAPGTKTEIAIDRNAYKSLLERDAR